MYRVVHRTAPVYLAELCQPCTDPQPEEISRYHAPTVISRTVYFLSLHQLPGTNYLHTFVPLQLCQSSFYPDSRLACTLHHLLFLRPTYYVRRPIALVMCALGNAILIDWLIDGEDACFRSATNGVAQLRHCIWTNASRGLSATVFFCFTSPSVSLSVRLSV